MGMFKSFLLYPLRFLNGLLDRATALLGAVLLAQFPQFYGQYLQRLSGHLNELRRTVETYEQAAAALGLTMEEFIKEHLLSDSDTLTASGEIIVGLMERLYRMEHSFAALAGATPWNRWLVFLQEAQWAIVRQTWGAFTPGVPTTAEGLTYAAVGLLLGWSTYTVLKTALLPLFRRVFTAKKLKKVLS